MTPAQSPQSAIQEVFRSLPSHWLLMVESSAATARKTVQELLSYHLSRGAYVIVLAASRPCFDVYASLKERGVPQEKMVVLCSVCTNDAKSVGNTLHLKQRQSLTEQSIAAGVIARHLKGKETVFLIDSLPSFLMYHPAATVARFMHCILVQFQREQLNGIVFSLQGAVDTTVREEIAQLCDSVVSL